MKNKTINTNKEICPRCGSKFIMGTNGTIEGCDKCCNVTRDRHGYAWFPKDQQHVYKNIKSGKITIVKREEELGG